MMNLFTAQRLKQRLPILKWAPTYDSDTLLHDFIAGLTVGLTAIPQGIAYAVVAGMEPQYGLYSAFIGCFVYIVFGSSKDITIGPTAIMALMSQKYVEAHGPDFAILLSFLSGCVILFLGILHLGFLVEFISMPVTIGFTSAAAITIGSSQIKGLLGISGKTHGVIDSWTLVFNNLDKVRIGDTILGVGTVVVLVFAKWCKDNATSSSSGKVISLLGLARNAVVVIFGTALAYFFYTWGNGVVPFKLTGTVNGGMPSISLPPFSTMEHNSTLSFLDMTEVLGSSLIAVPAISILESITIAKAFAKGKTLDATQEMIALGLCNIAGSFVQSMPTAGSFTRTAVNHASGVMTPFGGFFTGTLVLLALGFLTQTFYFIPKSTLSAVIITAMFYMLEYHAIVMLWRTKKCDLIPLFTTFVFSLLLGLEFGIIVGIAVNILFILYSSARPSVGLKWMPVEDQEVLVVTPSQSLVYPAVEYFRDVIVSSCQSRDSTAPVVIDGTHIYNIDSTMAKGLKLLIEDLTVRRQSIFLWRWQESAMVTCLGFDTGMGAYFRFDNTLETVIRGPGTLKSEDRDIIDNLIDSKSNDVTVAL
uniref:Sodium-independent sulfate anion transporter n=1 Tax=Cacopsylla melanoneura TaxID=428564 RepID=A0A8D8U5A1_9HEMI